MYDMSTHTVTDSLGGSAPLMLPEPMLAAPLGAGAVTAFDASGMGSWVGRVVTVVGTFGPFMSPPVPAFDPSYNLAADVDGDGIVELSFLISSGAFVYVVADVATATAYDAFGVAGSIRSPGFQFSMFTVPETESEFMNATVYFDWRDHMATSSFDVMPVLCGDFMAEGGYFGPSVGAGGANWNPDNL